MLVAKIASALKIIITTLYFRRRINVEEQHGKKHYRFLRGGQIPNMIHEHFRATGAHEAAQGLSDLFNIRLIEWWCSGFRYKMGPSSVSSKWNSCGKCPGRLVQVKKTRCCSASDHIGNERSWNAKAVKDWRLRWENTLIRWSGRVTSEPGMWG